MLGWAPKEDTRSLCLVVSPSQNFFFAPKPRLILSPGKKCPPLIYWLVHCAQPCLGRDGNKVRKGGGKSFSGFALSGSFLWSSAQSKASLSRQQGTKALIPSEVWEDLQSPKRLFSRQKRYFLHPVFANSAQIQLPQLR